jgi:hypothetical protein
VIFVDSNVPMYLVGGTHPHKADAQVLLERVVADRERLVTDAEVLQEILHRYTSINRRDMIQPAFESIFSVVDEVFGIDLPVVSRAREIVLAFPQLSARDAIHLGVMERESIDRILTFDLAFDQFPGIRRVAI